MKKLELLGVEQMGKLFYMLQYLQSKLFLIWFVDI